MADTTKVCVKVSTRSNFLYGFSSRMDETERTALGQTAFANQTGVLFGVNSPKPARMKKMRDSGRSASSFVAAGSRASALQAGWTLVKRARARGLSNSARVKTVYVKIPVGDINIQYAWNMPKTVYDALAAERAGLKILDASAESDLFDLVFGASFKPPRATNGTVSTYVAPDATLPAGWSMLRGEEE